MDFSFGPSFLGLHKLLPVVLLSRFLPTVFCVLPTVGLAFLFFSLLFRLHIRMHYTIGAFVVRHKL